MIYGYARVSTGDQDLALQLDALKSFGVDRVFEDTISGYVSERPALDELKTLLEPGDHVVVWKLDRLFRSLIEAVNQIEGWIEQEIEFSCITQSITTADSSPEGKLMRTVLLAFAEFERDLIRTRTKAGMEAAKKRGVVLGRPKKLTSDRLEWAKSLLDQGKSLSQAARTLQVSRTTLWRYLNTNLSKVDS